ncbi:hypothetical protein [Pleionea sp. CnH1-48]|uniref:hypothetical protein n=1 Tax=Pleionea sp. CnH1-48 TaxID=2954494 RepID=UPI0020973442|nr:hypothetical protein [Pleionea sp. CnH1-48]MCO7225509.1 hypothetical protein [Pleionea sp. CnH1-48]
MVLIRSYNKSLSLLALVVLTGCASFSPQEVDQRLAEYKTFEFAKLLQLWGVPTKQYELDNRFYVEWHNIDNQHTTSFSLGTSTSGRGWFGGLGVTLPINSSEDTCVRRAILNQNKKQVLDLQWEGDSDLCGELIKPLSQEVADKPS